MSATFLIVGAGEAGMAAAGALRTHGCTDRIVLVSDEAHHPYARPPLSKATLTDPNWAVEPIRHAAWLAKNDIDLRLGATVESINTETQHVTLTTVQGTETLAYHRLLLATGARVRRLAALAGLGKRVAYLRTFDDSIALRDRLVGVRKVIIVGGGVIGMEVASSARKLGLDVLVIEPAERVMARALSMDASADLLKLHTDAGVAVKLQTGVVSAESSPRSVRLTLTDDSTIEADLVVVAVGVDPDDRLARAIGCEVNNGIVVDETCATGVANVFAAGDVANFPHPLFKRRLRVEAWQHAGRHGAHAARGMLGQVAHYQEVPWFWTDQHGVNIQVAGNPNTADTHVHRGATTLHFHGDHLVAATTFNNAREMRPCINLIAAGWRGDPHSLGDLSRPLASFAANNNRSMTTA